jgi:2-amino-4-hydroxy-6-hydroxymethyldihydropteridine diphosphokinase
VSSWYATEPQGYRDQDWFINGAVQGVTNLSPRELLKAVKKIEVEMGRVQTIRWGPRVIDIDILFYGTDGQICVDEDDLYIPHKMLENRRFVLIPLMELAPGLVHPIYNETVKDLLRRVPAKGQKVKRIKRK